MDWDIDFEEIWETALDEIREQWGEFSDWLGDIWGEDVDFDGEDYDDYAVSWEYEIEWDFTGES